MSGGKNDFQMVEKGRGELIFRKKKTKKKCLSAKSQVSDKKVMSSEAEFKEFEPRLKFKPCLQYGWFHLKLC